MSIQSALVTQSHPYILASRLESLVRAEITKGCRPELAPYPVALEPRYAPIFQPRSPHEAEDPASVLFTPQSPSPPSELVRLQIWLGPDQPLQWNRSELFLKQLRTVSHRVGFELVGNDERVVLALLGHRRDLPVIKSAFHGQFQLCQLTPLENDLLGSLDGDLWKSLVFNDYFPPPPYSHLLTRPGELEVSPLEPLITAIFAIPAPAVGVYQALFQPVQNDWHRNIELLVDFEYYAKLNSGFGAAHRYPQQAPSSEIHQESRDVSCKAHTDKPILALAMRTAVIGAGASPADHLQALSAFMNLFQHGGRPLQCLTNEDYQHLFSSRQLRDMFTQGITYRSGFPVNSFELVGASHLPPAAVFVSREIPTNLLGLLTPRNPALQSGTPIGTAAQAGAELQICLPDEIREKHVHIIGLSGFGKSTVKEHMVISDIERGHGVAVIDPHGDLCRRLLCLIPEHAVQRVVYLDFGDEEFVPLFNPMRLNADQDPYRASDDLLASFKKTFTGWGDRLETLLRNSLISLLHLPDTTFLSVADLLRKKSPESERLKKEILGAVDNIEIRRFWQHDFEGYSKQDLSPPKHKLSKLFSGKTLSLMFSQPDNRIDLHQIANEGKVLLVNLSNLGEESRSLIGCILLAMFHKLALSRSKLPIDQRKPFRVYADEAQYFITDTISSVLVDCRKFGVGLCLAHHFLGQLQKKQIEALDGAGATIMFHTNEEDARHFAKTLQGKVKEEDLSALDLHEAVARMRLDVAKIKTLPPLQIPEKHYRDEIIAQSRRRYYRPLREVEADLHRKADPRRCRPLSHSEPGDDKKFRYQEFPG